MSNINSATYFSDVQQELDEQDQPAKSLVPVQQKEQPLLHLVSRMQENSRSLPVPYDFNSITSVSRLFASRFQNVYSIENYEKSRRELAIIMLGLVGFIMLSIVFWGVSKEINYLNGGGFIYNSGIVGGVLMLLTFIHSLVKRSTFVNRFISSTHSYYFHVVCGAVGALVIIVHSSFDFRSINSSVAFFSMLMIIVAGALGRYLYTQFTLSSHKLYEELKTIEPVLFASISAYNCRASERMRERLSRIALYNTRQPGNVLSYLFKTLTVIQRAIFALVASKYDLFWSIRKTSILSDLGKADIRNIKKAHKREIRNYIFKLTKMGYLNLLEQLFRHWRVLHVPFLYILTITALVHVVVVHMY